MELKETLLFIAAAIGLWIIGIVIAGLCVCVLWNWIMPGIFGLPYINVLQAIGLTGLAAFLTRPVIQANKKE